LQIKVFPFQLFSAVDTCRVLAPKADPYIYWEKLKEIIKKENPNSLSSLKRRIEPRTGNTSRYTDYLSANDLILVCRNISSPDSASFIKWIDFQTSFNFNYVLMHKNIPVLEINIDTNGLITKVGEIFSQSHIPFNIYHNNQFNFQVFQDWWKNRTIPASREGLRKLLDSLKLVESYQLLEKSYGLSLSDQYWICPKDSGLEWSNINFFLNPFSEDIGNILLGKIHLSEKILKSLKFNTPDHTLEGMLKKKWIIIENERFLLKSSSDNENAEAINEILASKICTRLGIPHVDYKMIQFKDDKYCICPDFINPDTELVSAWQIFQTLSIPNHVSPYEALIKAAEDLGIKNVRRRFEMMIVLDFLIVNIDRHFNNFGFIRDANTLEWLEVAPIYDSGYAMWCKHGEWSINPLSNDLESKPFRSTHDKQIKLVTDFSWINFSALEGIEEEYYQLFIKNHPAQELYANKARLLSSALSSRIKLLQQLAKEIDQDTVSKSN
jgi:hypothetical protein